MIEENYNIRTFPVRLTALFMSALLAWMPLMANSRSLILLMDDYGTAPAPITEEEEVKHACSINWCTVVSTDFDQHMPLLGPSIEDPYNEVEHFEVDVPPPKI